MEHRADTLRWRRGEAHQAYKFTAEVGEGGKVELTLPLPQGSRVEVVVLAEQEDEFADLRRAATETMGFWDNPQDNAERPDGPPS